MSLTHPKKIHKTKKKSSFHFQNISHTTKNIKMFSMIVNCLSITMTVNCPSLAVVCDSKLTFLTFSGIRQHTSTSLFIHQLYFLFHLKTSYFKFLCAKSLSQIIEKCLPGGFYSLIWIVYIVTVMLNWSNVIELWTIVYVVAYERILLSNLLYSF